MDDLAIFGGKPVYEGSWPRWPKACARERELVEEVLSSDLWGGSGLGPKIRELNEKFSRYCDTKYGAAVANGTVSMELCLEAWGIRPGDEVIVPAFTFMATPIAVHHQGATVVYVDIDPKTLNIDPRCIEEAITSKTKAIIPVHIGGHPCDMDPIMNIARKHSLKVLEDAAQSHGAMYKGRKTGSLGDAGSFSFQQSKNMQSGEGGFVTSNDRELIDIIHYSLGKFGRGVREKYAGHIHYRFGFNACYTEIQAALALAQLEHLEEETEKRVANAKRLYSMLDGIDGFEPFTWQPYCTRHGHHLFMFRIRSDRFEGVRRAQFLAAMNREGIICSSLYPMPLYRQPLYETEKKLSMRHFECPVTEEAAVTVGFFEQNILLADAKAIDSIAASVHKVRKNASRLNSLDVRESDFMGSAILKKAAKNAV